MVSLHIADIIGVFTDWSTYIANRVEFTVSEQRNIHILQIIDFQTVFGHQNTVCGQEALAAGYNFLDGFCSAAFFLAVFCFVVFGIAGAFGVGLIGFGVWQT